jgi:hypothetical protein
MDKPSVIPFEPYARAHAEAKIQAQINATIQASMNSGETVGIAINKVLGGGAYIAQ